jgi:hypothetical protein
MALAFGSWLSLTGAADCLGARSLSSDDDIAYLHFRMPVGLLGPLGPEPAFVTSPWESVSPRVHRAGCPPPEPGTWQDIHLAAALLIAAVDASVCGR